MGQNAYLGLSPLLSNLISTDQYVPSLADIAQYALNFFGQTFDDFKFRVGEDAMFEVAIFGFCLQSQQLSAYHFIPKLQAGVWRMTLTHYPLANDGAFLYLGDNKEEMNAAIRDAFAGQSSPGRMLSRIPRHVIQEKIDGQCYKTIGGDLQLGIAEQFGFRPLKLLKPRISSQGGPYFSLLGRELTPDLCFVGRAIVGGDGMV